MSNLENETNQNNLSDIVTVKNETVQLSEVKNINSLINIQVDEIFKKKVNFLGLMQQIFGVISIIGGVIWCLSIVGVLFGSQFLDIIIKFIIGILSIMIGIKSFKSGNAYKKSMLTLEGNDLKNGLTIYSDVMKFTLILYIVSFLFYIMIIIRIVSIL